VQSYLFRTSDNRVEVVELLFGSKGHRTERWPFRLASMFLDDLQNARKYSHPFSHMDFSSGAYGISQSCIMIHANMWSAVVQQLLQQLLQSCISNSTCVSNFNVARVFHNNIHIGSVFSLRIPYCVALLSILANECKGIDPLLFQSLLGRVWLPDSYTAIATGHLARNAQDVFESF